MRLTRCLTCGRVLYANRIPFICNACRLHYKRKILLYFAVGLPINTAAIVIRMLAR